MRGDFSKWEKNLKQNYNGLVQQQGRVLLDSDWNEQMRISEDRRQTMLRDVVGANVAAVPAELPESLKVTQAEVTAENKIWLDINAGRVWINGLSLDISGENRHRLATYLSSSTGSVDDIANGVRDAVILELWQEELNSFQDPKRLLESALGGPDTTEKIHTSMALKLLRLEADDHCRNLKDKLAAEDNNKGKLIVTLEPNTTTNPDCPEVETGGYAGFEHNLYRLEIAHVNQGADNKRFKWSNVNGGLVGRGTYDATDPLHKKIILTANQPAIINSQKDNFYLEIVEFNGDAGNNNVIYGAEATLNGNVLELGQEHYVTNAPSTVDVFFRLWDGIKLVSDYPKTGDAQELKQGIRLAFDDEAGVTYRPEDFWTFDVRVGQKYSETPLIDDEAPQGIIYHRAPLGILHWDADKTISFDEDQIDDCRNVFRPLTQQNGCCTYTIGDGKSSQGDFNDFNLALRHLPQQGGQLCLLPGVHEFNTQIQNKKKIRITGCGLKTIVHPEPEKASEAIFEVLDSQQIQIDNLTIVSFTGPTIKMATTEDGDQDLKKIKINDNRIISCHSTIIVYDGIDVCIKDNELSVLDKEKSLKAIYFKGEHSSILNNRINVIPAPKQQGEDTPDDAGTPDGSPGETIFDDCDDGVDAYASDETMVMLIQLFFYIELILVVTIDSYQYKAQGGIQIGSSSEHIAIKDNKIIGGRGHGISFGHLPSKDGNFSSENDVFIENMNPETKAMMEEKFESFIYDIEIKNNDIRQMGKNGISSTVFFEIEKLNYLMTVKNMEIVGNRIEHCARQPELPVGSVSVAKDMAYGGIVLADAENIIIRENRIERNGLSHLQAVCGIWMGQGEKIEISDNRIIDNGPRTSLEDSTAAKGWRGGIVIRLSLNAVLENVFGLLATEPGEIPNSTMMFQDSLPAAKIHDNTVVQPLGQALIVMAMGPVSIANNHFTSQGTVNVGLEEGKLSYDYIAMLGATVIVANLGIAKDIFPLIMLSSFGQLGQLHLFNESEVQEHQSINGSEGVGEGSSGAAPGSSLYMNAAVGNPISMIDISKFNLAALLYLPSGQVMFNDNRTTLDLRAPGMSVLLNSQVIISLDDISYANNQSEIASVITFNPALASTGLSAFAGGDIAGNNTMLAAFTVRATNNRFQDGLTQGIPQKGYSLFSFAMMNTTMGNQATNCLLPLGPAKYNFKFGNTVIFNARCRRMIATLYRLYRLEQEQGKMNQIVELKR